MRSSALRRSAIDRPVHDWAGELQAYGYCIIPNLVPRGLVAALHDDLQPRFERTPFCEGDFYGRHTKRFGGLLKRSQHAAAFVHVGKATQPDKTIVVFEITKWTDNAYSKSFLRLNKLVFKQLDQPFTSPVMQRRLP